MAGLFQPVGQPKIASGMPMSLLKLLSLFLTKKWPLKTV